MSKNTKNTTVDIDYVDQACLLYTSDAADE